MCEIPPVIVNWSLQNTRRKNRETKIISTWEFSKGWNMECFWSRNLQPSPHALYINRTTADEDLVVGGKLTLLRNGTAVFEKKFLQLMESGDTFIEIKLYKAETLPKLEISHPLIPLRLATDMPSFLLKGCIEISPFRGSFGSAPPRKALMGIECLSQGFARLARPKTSRIAADVELKCGSASIPAHKTVLCARSPVFAAMFAHPMRESAENQVHINDINKSVLRTMVNYMYTGVVESMESTSPQKMTVSTALELLVAADKYLLWCLKEMCREFLKENVSVENVMMLLDLGDAVDGDLKCFAMDYLYRFLDFSAILNTGAWKSLKQSKPAFSIEILSSVVKWKDEKKEEEKRSRLCEMAKRKDKIKKNEEISGLSPNFESFRSFAQFYQMDLSD